MKTKPLTFLLALTFLFLFSGSSVVFSNDLQDGVDAHTRGDFETAHRIFLKLAKKGHVEAQYNLGVMYEHGRGVPKNHKEAVKWYRLAAEQELVNKNRKVSASKNVSGLVFISSVSSFLPSLVLFLFVVESCLFPPSFYLLQHSYLL